LVVLSNKAATGWLESENGGTGADRFVVFTGNFAALLFGGSNADRD